MDEPISSDNDNYDDHSGGEGGRGAARGDGGRGPDAHGQAAMLLVESLMHDLIARHLLSVEDAMEVVGVAAAAVEEAAIEHASSPIPQRSSLTLLDGIRNSLGCDLLGG